MRHFFKTDFLCFFASGFSRYADRAADMGARFAGMGGFFGGLRGFDYVKTGGNQENRRICPFGPGRLFGDGIVLRNAGRVKKSVVFMCGARSGRYGLSDVRGGVVCAFQGGGN